MEESDLVLICKERVSKFFMPVKVTNTYDISHIRDVVIRCPHCRNNGCFAPLGGANKDTGVGHQGRYVVGYRQCPNPACKYLVFFVYDDGSRALNRVFPPVSLDFDSTDIPVKIASALREAVTCHAHECFVASAIMIRKTLEEICFDKSVQGKNLKERISTLGSQILIPRELIEGMDELRLLGNDAAHIESTAFNQVSKDEVEVGIEFAKEILKAVYQYQHLLSQLRKLKTVKAPPQNT
ncbi:MAG: DUF4145 domain-containing protein [Limisphaerales bacterium]